MNSKEKKIQEEQTIDLLELFVRLLKKWYLLIACAVIGGVLAGYMTHTEVIPIYSASSMLFVAKTGTLDSIYDLQFGQTMSEDFIVISKSKPVIDTTIEKLYEKEGIRLTRGEVQGAVSCSELEDTHIIKFEVTNTDPKIACALCNALTETMQDQIAYIMSTDKPTIVELAEENPYPINAGAGNNRRQVMIGAAGGFMFCALVIVVLYLLDDKINTAEDVERYLGATVLVSVPYDRAQTFETNSKSKKRKKSKSHNS